MTLANPDGKKFPDYRRTHQAENTSERGMLRPGRSGESRVSSFRNSMPSAYRPSDRRKTWTISVWGSTIQYSGTPDRS